MVRLAYAFTTRLDRLKIAKTCGGDPLFPSFTRRAPPKTNTAAAKVPRQ